MCFAKSDRLLEHSAGAVFIVKMSYVVRDDIFTTPASGKGCLGVVTMACAVVVVGILWFVSR
jgi:hypothetical protein